MSSGKQRIFALTGAGISRESGLETFRDADGIWSRVNLEDVATVRAFQRDPNRVHAFYNARRAALLSPQLKPNAAHFALAELERTNKVYLTLVTQNIDNLHERAGNQHVIHMHGELLKASCINCGDVSDCQTDLSTESVCPNCGRTGTLRPDVVWFGEMPKQMAWIGNALENADTFVAIGTSGSVYPAAGFVETARSRGIHTVELNLERSEVAAAFEEGFYGPATQVVPEFVNRVLRS